VSNLAATERASLSDLLDELGPFAPTLCEGWRTRDLTAHLVLRESRLDALAGIVIGALAGRTARVQRKLAHRNFGELVNRLRTGPPWWSPFRLPRFDEGGSNVEFFVHHEDVRRAQPDWKPRVLDAATDELLWRRCRRIARLALRTAPGGIELLRSDTGERHTGRAPAEGRVVLTLSGPPQELLLYLYGRRDHALVEPDGDAETFRVLEKS
jgi:uncharacterized protein (TIGR03085 family)